MSQDHRIISVHQLDLVDLLRVDAHYAKLSDAVLTAVMPSYYGLDALRRALSRGDYFYCSDIPQLQLVFYHQGDYYINPAGEQPAGEAVLNALKQRFSFLDLDKPAPYQINQGLLNRGIRRTYYPPRTEQGESPRDYIPDHTPANTTPIEKTVKNWLVIRFYHFNANGEREYLEDVPYSINNKYEPIDRSIFEQGKSPLVGPLNTRICPMTIFIRCTMVRQAQSNIPKKSWSVCVRTMNWRYRPNKRLI